FRLPGRSLLDPDQCGGMSPAASFGLNDATSRVRDRRVIMTSTSPDRQDSATSPWFATWFDSAHYHKLYSYRDDREASAFVDALVGQMHVRDGVRVLDLGCGAGRHARQLALHGCHVTGLDLSAGSIREACRFEQAHL